MGLFISYRRTGGVLALLAFAAVALAATVLAVVIGAAVLVVVLVVAAVAVIARAVLPAGLWHHTVSSSTPWPHETFDTTVVNPAASLDEGDLLRLGSDKG